MVKASRNCMRISREHTATQHGSRSDRSVIPLDGNSSAFTSTIISAMEGWLGIDVAGRDEPAEVRWLKERDDCREAIRLVDESERPGNSET